MKNKVCSECEYFKIKFLILYKCDKHGLNISQYESVNCVCDDWKPNIKSKIHFREVKRYDGCK